MYLTSEQKQRLIYASSQLELLSKLAPRYLMTEEIQIKIFSVMQPVFETLIEATRNNEEECLYE